MWEAAADVCPTLPLSALVGLLAHDMTEETRNDGVEALNDPPTIRRVSLYCELLLKTLEVKGADLAPAQSKSSISTLLVATADLERVRPMMECRRAFYAASVHVGGAVTENESFQERFAFEKKRQGTVDYDWDFQEECLAAIDLLALAETEARCDMSSCLSLDQHLELVVDLFKRTYPLELEMFVVRVHHHFMVSFLRRTSACRGGEFNTAIDSLVRILATDRELKSELHLRVLDLAALVLVSLLDLTKVRSWDR